MTSDFPKENGKTIPSFVFVGFMESNMFDVQISGKSAFDWFPVSSAVYRLGIDRYPDIYKKLEYPRTNSHESFCEKEFFSQTHLREIIRPIRRH